MFIGNIVSETKLNRSELFNYSTSLEDIDRSIPTLIIGWNFSKKIVDNKKLNILTKTIEDNINWTFTKRERRIDYEKDLNIFIKKSLKNVEILVNYKYINLLTCGYSDIKNLLKKLNKNNTNYIYIYRNTFIYICVNNYVFGLDFNIIDYLNIDRKKIYKHLYSTKNILFFSDDFLMNEIKENIENNKIIPYLYAVKNDKARE